MEKSQAVVLEVWETLWPEGIGRADFARALRVADTLLEARLLPAPKRGLPFQRGQDARRSPGGKPRKAESLEKPPDLEAAILKCVQSGPKGLQPLYAAIPLAKREDIKRTAKAMHHAQTLAQSVNSQYKLREAGPRARRASNGVAAMTNGATA